MPSRQRTFELVPDAPAGFNGPRGLAQSVSAQSKPPMTTKQAQKLHRKAGKGPKLSKAEQRRIELMEQDRIRKEFEKEKAQARAKAVRDKRKAKEEQERETRRKKGLPLVDVHPSQDTLSRFLKVGKVRQVSPGSQCANSPQHQNNIKKAIPDEFLKDKENNAPEFPVDGSPKRPEPIIAPSQPKAAAMEILDIPFMATQDFFLSSQDYREITGHSHKQPPFKAGAIGFSRQGISSVINASIQPVIGLSTAEDHTHSNEPLADTLSPFALGTSDNRGDAEPTESADIVESLNSSGKLHMPQLTRRSLHEDNKSPSQSENLACTIALVQGDTQPWSPGLHSPVMRARPCRGPQKPSVSSENASSPNKSLRKKRMFGSSGPGAETLVAMERSYQQNLRDRRNRNAGFELHDSQFESLGQHAVNSVMDQVNVGNGPRLSQGPVHDSGKELIANTQKELNPVEAKVLLQSAAVEMETMIGHGLNCQPSSQETDYGDIDFATEEEILALVECTAGSAAR